MMRAAEIAAFVLAALSCAPVSADQRIACPPSTAPLESAAPVLGPPQDPPGELREVETVRRKDGTYVAHYDLSGGVAGQLEKRLICRYRDQSTKAVKLPMATKECRITTMPPRHHLVEVACGT